MKKIYGKIYKVQKSNAQQRGIDWHFTYDSWVEWWGDDIALRGKGKDKLVMARNNDTGPYHPDNVRKLYGWENCSEAHKGKPKSEEHRLHLRKPKNKKLNCYDPS